MASSPKFEGAGVPPGAAAPVSSEGTAADEKTALPWREMQHYRTLIARVVDVFGDEIKASRWLSLPNKDFNGMTPMQVAQGSGYELMDIEPVLIRIEHGVEF